MRKKDKGIDRIYENNDGEHVAAQCKWKSASKNM
jgi:predicted helicase